MTDGAVMNEGDMSIRLGLRGWPNAAEDVIVSRNVILSRYTGAHIHMQHISSALSVEIVRRAKAEVAFGYRKVEGVSGLVFLAAEWALAPGDPAALREIRAATLQARADKQPLELPSAGSVFKRPPEGYASRLIDACGLKGLTVGRAQVSPKHAGFIVNLGGATARDVMELIGRVRETVLAKTGVRLELEQIPLGF